MARNFYRFNIPSGDAYDTAYSNNMAFMQYEYDEINGTSEVTGNWNVIKQVKENDIILLGYDSRIYAWGYAIKPRKDKHKSDKIEYLNFDDMINNILDIDGVKYISSKYKGIIYFNDCECFYNNLTEILENNKYGGYCWGQRVDIDKWRQHSENKGILTKDFDLEGSLTNDIYKIQNRKTACKIIEELTGDIVSEYDNLLLGECIELLMQNRNLILTGAPGTGKTYLAKQIASEIGKYKFVQFHPSYDYTDFVEGLRPKNDNGNIGFERKDGVFKEFRKEALNNQSSNFVFIIDEINRGEISKIFGELFFSVDSGYRGEKGKVQTQYANLIEDGDEFKDGFYIPENVYIIGTMNDIDRSVESMDFAMRRRFAWKEIKAEDTQETILNDLENLKDEAIKRMNNLNKVIRNKETNLSEAYCIGAAYFKKIKDYEGDFDKLLDNHLKGLLFEYTRGMQNQETILKELKNAYDLKDNLINDNSNQD